MQSILFQGSLIQIKNLDLSKLLILKEPQILKNIQYLLIRKGWEMFQVISYQLWFFLSTIEWVKK